MTISLLCESYPVYISQYTRYCFQLILCTQSHKKASTEKVIL